VIIESVHQLGNACRIIPPVDVQYVNVICLEFLQTGFKRVLESLGMHSSKIGLNYVLALMAFVRSVSRGEFGRNDHFIPTVALSHPLTNPSLRLLTLVVTSCIYEVSTPA
jgi:hypothetical protein